MKNTEQNPEVRIMLDRERWLRWDLNAMCMVEEATGVRTVGNADIAKELDARMLRAMLWACLIHEDSELTIDQVGRMLHPGNMEYVSNQLLAAWTIATPEVTEAGPLV